MKKYYLSIASLSFVILFGLSLNDYWYIDFFRTSGYPGLIPFFMAAFFILSELVLWGFSSEKNPTAVFLKYSLVVFSIFATLSSQYSATSQLEKDNAEIVYEKVGTSEDVDYYREQIKIQDVIIQQYVRTRTEDHVLTLTNDEYIEAKETKKEYEKKLEEAKAVNSHEVEQVFTVSTIYSWIAVELPAIFREGFTENFVRVIFQLFSSILLAMMSPVAISTIRRMNRPEIKVEPVTEQEHTESTEHTADDFKTELILHAPSKKQKLSKHEKSDIIKMMYWNKEKNTGPVMTSQKTSLAFKKMYEGSDKPGRIYTEEECQAVWDEIGERGMRDTDVNIIREEFGL